MNRKTFLIFISVLISLFAHAQNYASKTTTELEQMKANAVADKNFILANELKNEINSRKSATELDIPDEKAKVEADLQKAISAEDYTKAHELKEKKLKLDKIEKLAQQIQASISMEEYEKADELKHEKIKLIAELAPSGTPQINNGAKTAAEINARATAAMGYTAEAENAITNYMTILLTKTETSNSVNISFVDQSTKTTATILGSQDAVSKKLTLSNRMLIINDRMYTYTAGMEIVTPWDPEKFRFDVISELVNEKASNSKVMPNQIFNGEEVNVLFSSSSTEHVSMNFYNYFSVKTGLPVGSRMERDYSKFSNSFTVKVPNDTTITIMQDYRNKKNSTLLIPYKTYNTDLRGKITMESETIESAVNIDANYFRKEIFDKYEEVIASILGITPSEEEKAAPNGSVFPVTISIPARPYIYITGTNELMEMRKEESTMDDNYRAVFEGSHSGANVSSKQSFKVVVKLPTENDKKLFCLSADLKKCDLHGDKRVVERDHFSGKEAQKNVAKEIMDYRNTVGGYDLVQIATGVYEIVPHKNMGKGEYVFIKTTDSYSFGIE